MIEKIEQNFNNNDNQLIISELKKRYQLSDLEYISLIDILIYYYIISAHPNTLKIGNEVCELILRYREELKLNRTPNFFKEALTFIIKQELSINYDYTIRILNELIQEEYVFHSFNAAFYNQINEKGLIVQEKPWNLDEIENIRNIFKQQGYQNIFGYYQGQAKTPIFFASSLVTSPYYGLSSPTFFRKFIEHNSNFFNTFLNRDYERALKSIHILCQNLSNPNKEYVLNFFNKYWNEFTNGELPYVAISTRKRLGLASNIIACYPNESLEEYYIRSLLSQSNFSVHNDITRDKFDLFSYGTLSLKKKQKEVSKR